MSACNGSTGRPSATTIDPRFAYDSAASGDFYTSPADLSGRHGDVIRAESIPSPLRGATGWRILYRSESPTGHPVAVSGIVLVPTSPAAVPRPIVAWAHPTVGSADACAPSRGDLLAQSADPTVAAIIGQLQSFVDRGYLITATDYEGLGTPGPHPFLNGVSEARSVLDSVLAARQVPGADAGTHAVVYGLSQGGHAALFAGQLAKAWTPQLDLVGVVAAAPPAEFDQLLPLAEVLLEGYFVLSVYGQAAADPALDVARVLRADVAREAPTILETSCFGDVQDRIHALAGGRLVGIADPTNLPDWRAALAAMTPGATATAAPILIVQGELDPLVPAETTRTLVQRLCARGDTIEASYFAGVGHGASVEAGDAVIRAFVDDRFAGKLAVSSC